MNAIALFVPSDDAYCMHNSQKRVEVIVVQFCRKFAKNSWTMFYYWWIDLFFDVLANFLIRHVPPCEYWIRLKGKLSENQYDSNRNMVVWLYHLVNNLLLIIKWRGVVSLYILCFRQRSLHFIICSNPCCVRKCIDI